jgi:hypothetical protein
MTSDIGTLTPGEVLTSEDHGIVVSNGNSLSLTPSCTLDEAGTGLQALLGRADQFRFLIGDIYNAMNQRWGVDSSQYLDEWAETTLVSYGWVASKIPPELRDRDIPWRWWRDMASLPLPAITTVLASVTTRAEKDYRSFLEAVSLAKGTLPREPQLSLRERCELALEFSDSREGETWDASCTGALRELLT